MPLSELGSVGVRQQTKTALYFGPYRLIPMRRMLMRDDAPISIGSRAFDILTALVGQAGSLLPKEQLIAAAWPNACVHEANLRVHIAGLRKILGDGRAGERYIVSEAGRGYRFVAPVSYSDEEPHRQTPAATGSRPTDPRKASGAPLIGRENVVDALVELAARRRIVTLVGPGGVGKTAVAMVVAERIGREIQTVFIDLGPLGDPGLVPSKVSAALGFATQSSEPVSELAAFLRDKRMLIVLDTCERIIDGLAPLLEAATSDAPGLQVLATSREPLRAKGEYVQRLAPLSAPDIGQIASSEDALSFSAVRLFVERACAGYDPFELTDANAALVARICRKLDGLPLAIELAAARIDAFGVKGLSDLLDRHLPLPRLGRRMAPARHRTLEATLDWSYETLPERERMTLRRLAVFAGRFALKAAIRVAAFGALSDAETVDGLASLVECSLIAADIGETDAQYRLLDTTRAYAFDRLREADEADEVSRHHARRCLALLEDATPEKEAAPAQWARTHLGEIDNVRAAIDWAFSASGDTVIGVALTVAAIPYWTYLSMSDECCARAEAAFVRLDREDPANLSNVMQLATVLASGWFWGGRAVPDVAAWSKTLTIAERLGDVDFQLRALWGSWTEAMTKNCWLAALDIAHRFTSLAEQSPIASDALIAQRLVATAHHFLGDQETSQRLIEDMLARFVPHPSHLIRFLIDQNVTALTILPFSLWLRGFPDQATHVVEAAVKANASGHVISVSYIIARTAIPIAFLVGDLAAADRLIADLRERSTLPGTAIWTKWLPCHEAVRRIEAGDPAGGERLASVLDPAPTGLLVLNYSMLLRDLAEAERVAGRIDAARRTAETAIARSRAGQELWIMPELLRVRGEIAIAGGAPDEAEACFRDSMEMARRQTALSWELRTATSFARLRQSQGRAAEARGALAAVYDRFTEGFETRDLRKARELLDELSRPLS